MTKKTIRNVLRLLLLAILLVSIGMTIRQQLLYRSIASDSAEAAQIAKLPELGTQAPGFAAPAEAGPPDEGAPPEENEIDLLANIDLEALRTVNKDITGWIVIPGTELSYPLIQGADNQYYLSHNWKREASSGGSVFLESTSSGDLTDFHTIVYAHEMRDDSMFGSLKYYKDADYWREHPSIYIVTDAGVYRYDIFSAQETGVREIVYRLDLEENHLEEEFLRYCLNGSVIETGLEPGPDDRILTLSTCAGSRSSVRWVVHGRLAQTYSVEPFAASL